MWFNAKPDLACLQAAVAEVLSAFLIISRYRFPPSPCAASDDLYSHIMNPISPVTQQKTLFIFINSLLPWQISKLNHASCDAHPAQRRWQWCAAQVKRRRRRAESEQPVQQQQTLLYQFCCNVKLYTNSVYVWGRLIHKNGRLCRFNSCYFSVRLFSAGDRDFGAAAVWAALCAQVLLSIWTYVSLPGNTARVEQVGKLSDQLLNCLQQMHSVELCYLISTPV